MRKISEILRTHREMRIGGLLIAASVVGWILLPGWAKLTLTCYLGFAVIISVCVAVAVGWVGYSWATLLTTLGILLAILCPLQASLVALAVVEGLAVVPTESDMVSARVYGEKEPSSFYPEWKSTARGQLDSVADHGPERVACDGQWNDLRRRASQNTDADYVDFLRDCLSRNPQ